MLTKKIVLATLAGTALLAASAVQARDGHHRGHGYRHHGHHVHFRHLPHRVVVRPARVYYFAPAPVYYPPQPVYYAPPRPVLFGTLPVGDARVRIGVQF
jgi:hypothetical protein